MHLWVIKYQPDFVNCDKALSFFRESRPGLWLKVKELWQNRKRERLFKREIPSFFRNRAAEHNESLEEDAKDGYNLQCESLRERFTPKELQTLLFQLVWMQTEQPTIRKKISIKEHFVQGLKSDLKKMLYFYTTKGRDRFHWAATPLKPYKVGNTCDMTYRYSVLYYLNLSLRHFFPQKTAIFVKISKSGDRYRSVF